MTKKKSKWRCPRDWTAEQRLAHYTTIDPLSGCRIWQASTKPNGYGQLTFQMRRMMAHRVAWIARHGPIPKGLEVCHRCDERRCCNPDHLFLGSHAENMADLRIKRRARRRIPLEPFPDDLRAADMRPIQLFFGGREYVGRAVVRPFDPYRNAGKASGNPDAGQLPARRR